MKLLKYLMSMALVMILISCEIPDQPKRQEYPVITTLEGTVWHYYLKVPIVCDINFETAEQGTMTEYADEERKEVTESCSFSYTFVPATEKVEAIVKVEFEDGLRYGGMLIHKGDANLLINGGYVYWIQLYEINDKDEIIYDENGKIKSSMLMWKE